MSIYLKLDIENFLKDKKKGSKRQIQLAKKAIEIISEEGLESLSFEVLSKKCKIARTLIYHYFPKQLDLILFASALIRHNYQNFVISRMKNKNTMKELLSAYISAALEWVDAFPKEAPVWIVFFRNVIRIQKSLLLTNI